MKRLLIIAFFTAVLTTAICLAIGIIACPEYNAPRLAVPCFVLFMVSSLMMPFKKWKHEEGDEKERVMIALGASAALGIIFTVFTTACTLCKGEGYIIIAIPASMAVCLGYVFVYMVKKDIQDELNASLERQRR